MKRIILIIAAIFVISLPSKAQEILEMKSIASGLSAELHLGISGWICDDLDVSNENGFHFGLKAGYGFTEWIEAFIEYDHSIITPEDQGLSKFPYNHLDIGARFNFGSTVKAFRYFAEAGMMFQTTTQEAFDLDTDNIFELKMDGYGLLLGAGIKYHFQLPLVFIAGAKYGIGTFDTIEIEGYDYDDEWDADSYRIYLGMAYYF